MTKLTPDLKRILKNPDKRREWIRYQLAMCGETYASLGRKTGIDRHCIYHALAKPYPKVEAMLAKEMGLEPKDLFPERYTADGLPNRGRLKRYYQSSKPRAEKPRNVQQSEAI